MPQKISHRKTIITTITIVFLMFGFGFALVPLYDVFCDITGINGKTSNSRYTYSAIDAKIDTSRTVTVQFVTTNNAGMPWEFKPTIREIKVHPGEEKEVLFYAKNSTNSDMTGQAIPSISPGHLSSFLHKIECFCFNNQPLKAGEAIDMPLRFTIDPEFPKDTQTITLSYTMFDITDSK